MTLERGAKVKHAPYAFTERGAIMAANILNHALPTTQRRRCLARVETPQPTRRHPRPDGRLAPVHRQEKVGRRLRSALFTQKRNRPEPVRGHLNLQSAVAQPSKFLTTDGHEWARINPDQAGEPASPKVRPYNESISQLLSVWYPCPSVCIRGSTAVFRVRDPALRACARAGQSFCPTQKHLNPTPLFAAPISRAAPPMRTLPPAPRHSPPPTRSHRRTG